MMERSCFRLGFNMLLVLTLHGGLYRCQDTRKLIRFDSLDTIIHADVSDVTSQADRYSAQCVMNYVMLDCFSV